MHTRQPAGRRRTMRRPRVVAYNNVFRQRHQPDESGWLVAYHTGLSAAELLRRHFPQHYLQVARNRVTLPSLVGITEYFLRLAHANLFALDEGWADINLYGDPEAALVAPARPLADTDAVSILCEDFRRLVFEPFPCFWGLPREWEALFTAYATPNNNIVLLALWHLCSATSWSYLDGEPGDLVELEDDFTPNVWAIIMSLPRLPKHTHVEQLCDYLDTQELVLAPDVPPLHGLGSILRFCFRRTGNGFADYSPDIIYEDFGGQVGFDFFSSDTELRENREAQRAAEQIYRQYDRLDDLVRTTPTLLIALADGLLAAAASLDQAPHLGVHVVSPEVQPCPVSLEDTMTTPTFPQAKERPWKKRRAKPNCLPQENILTNGEQPEAQISIYEDGTTLLTRRDRHGFRCYPIALPTLAHTLAQVPMSVGPLPPGTLGTGYIQGQPWYCMYVPPQVRTLRTMVRNVERRFTLLAPPLIWWGWTNQCKLWALAHVPEPGTFPALDSQLHVAPFPNCNPRGHICWGTAQAPVISTAADLRPALDRFLEGTYFNHHQIEGKSKAYPVNVILAWNDIPGDTCYPLDDLVPVNLGTNELPVALDLGQVINAQWHVRT